MQLNQIKTIFSALEEDTQMGEFLLDVAALGAPALEGYVRKELKANTKIAAPDSLKPKQLPAFMEDFAKTLSSGNEVDIQQKAIKTYDEWCHIPELLKRVEAAKESGRFEKGLADFPDRSKDDRPLAQIIVVDPNPEYLKFLQETYRHHAAELKDFRLEVLQHIYDPSDPKNLGNFISTILSNPELHCVVMGHFKYHAAGQNGNKAISLVPWASRIKEARPDLELFLTTIGGKAPSSIFKKDPYLYRRAFIRGEAAEMDNAFFAIIEPIRKKKDTPFFSALVRYAESPIDSFHALASSRAKSLRKSSWIQGFLDFYGAKYFLAENSATIVEMDSLLAPKGAIRDAQEAAARAFGSRHSFFVTNGTSTANKIVLQAIINPGDHVLIDRNCHKSHHYGMVLSGGHPHYLEPFHLNKYGISGGITLATIKKALEDAIDKGTPPKALLLTNHTFDGILTNPTMVIEMVHGVLKKANLKLRDFIFFFDEAWFAYGKFHHRFYRHIGMWAAEQWNREHKDDDIARIYATHSTHKSLTAFRQGSMIHVSDPVFEKDLGLRHRFDEAYFTHTSTSPNYAILASLDAGRSQMELEGYKLVDQAVELAQNLRKLVNNDPKLKDYFRILGEDELLGKHADYFRLSPTMMTLYIKKGYTGSQFRELMLRRFNIQFNKTSPNTALLMTNLGSTRTAIDRLYQVLRIVADELRYLKKEANDELPKIPPFSGFYNKDANVRKYFFNEGIGQIHSKSLDDLLKELEDPNKSYVSATFVIPYPPGYPILIPGQIINKETLSFLKDLDVGEIHGMPDGKTLRYFDFTPPIPVVKAKPLSKMRKAALAG